MNERDGLEALTKWVNGAVLRRVEITSHLSGCRITLSEGFDTSCSREGEPHKTALSAVEFAQRPSQKRRILEHQLKRVEVDLIQAKEDVRSKEREARILEKQLGSLGED